MVNIYYQNNYGQKVDLMALPYKIRQADLHDYTWKYQSRDSLNPTVTRFYRSMESFSVGLDVYAVTEKTFHQAMNQLLEVTDKDVQGLTPGRLYVNSEYLPCYIVSSAKSNWMPGLPFVSVDLSLISEKGQWIKETRLNFTGSSGSTEAYMDYPFDYAYDYSSSTTDGILVNTGFLPADFELTVYGACAGPQIVIAGHAYKVSCGLQSGDHLIVNSLNKKIYKVTQAGERINQFHLRRRDSYIFEKIPAGDNTVVWDGSFAFGITLYEERSEPTWI